jgi:hypothetical protein
MAEYHHSQRTRFTLEECEASVGKRAKLVLTGTITEARSHENGDFVMFEADERFGFSVPIGGDLELFEVTD